MLGFLLWLDSIAIHPFLQRADKTVLPFSLASETEAKGKGLTHFLHLLNTSLKLPQAAAFDHLVKEHLGHSSVQQLQVT